MTPMAAPIRSEISDAVTPSSDAGAADLTPAAAAAALLCLTYPLVLQTALALGQHRVDEFRD